MSKDRIDELLAELRFREDTKHKNKILWFLAVIGAIAAFAGIAYAIYRFFAPDYLEDFEDDFDEDFDEYFDDEEDHEDEAEAAPAGTENGSEAAAAQNASHADKQES